MAVDLQLDTGFSSSNLLQIVQTGHKFKQVVDVAARVQEKIGVEDSSWLRFADAGEIGKTYQPPFFQSDAVSLTEEVVVEETFESVNQRHILGQSTNKGDYFEFFLL